MKKILLISGVVVVCVICAVIIFSKDEVDSSILSSGTKTPITELERIHNIDKDSYKEISNIVLDNREIDISKKNTIIIFGSNGCSYCDKLKNSIRDTSLLQNRLKEEFSLYYVNLSYAKKHKIFVQNNEEIPNELSTKELANMYFVSSTPTIIFIAPNGRNMFSYNGFIMPDRFLATLDFFNDKQVQNLSRDDITRKLLTMYEQEGI